MISHARLVRSRGMSRLTDRVREQLSRDAISTYTLVINNYPQSDYAKDARDKMQVAFDQLAGKEMSVGRYYLGNGQYAAAINRFKVVVEQYQTSTQPTLPVLTYRSFHCRS